MIGAAATPLDELLITEHIICAVTKRSLPNCSLMALGQAGTGPSRVAVGPVATDAMLAAYRQARGEVSDQGLHRGAGDENRTRTLSLGITWYRALLMVSDLRERVSADPS
ncbi:hypothetical protein [Streptomyces sp. NBC_01363]|uniref:hypothetical protein n=1 Tax=Streptomyces sp. NBC_01363 TaxID=2903840 RepID=UPI00224FCDFD|nr:hypothetical protein [Streptomyces sp. NBC_01363]MCX4731150.1 hypothetical protein [Streptomyces sp. NBC_01363]